MVAVDEDRWNLVQGWTFKIIFLKNREENVTFAVRIHSIAFKQRKTGMVIANSSSILPHSFPILTGVIVSLGSWHMSCVWGV